jgi:hypothetical protein
MKKNVEVELDGELKPEDHVIQHLKPGEPIGFRDPKKCSGKIPGGCPLICMYMNPAGVAKDPFDPEEVWPK